VSVAGTTNLNGITDWEIGDWAIFNGAVWQKVDNTDVTGGNANITSINVSAIQALQTGSTLSTTTFYNVTNAAGSTRVLQVYAIANNTNVVWAVDVTTGEVGTYDIAGDVFVLTANVRYVANNLFIGVNNAGNTIDGSSTNNVFNENADSNTLVGSANNIFGFNCQNNSLDNSANNTFSFGSSSHVLINASYCEFGLFSNTCEAEDSSQNKIGNYCSVIKLLNATDCIFNDFVLNLDIVVFGGASAFNLCTVASGDYSIIDFANATSLFGRTSRWSINKVLDTDLIEVTFDTNLPTAQTGQYDTSTNTFTPYASTYNPTITPDGTVATNGIKITDWVYSLNGKVLTLSGNIRSDCDFTAGEDATFTFTYPLGVTLSTSSGSGSCYGQTTDPAAPFSVTESDGTLTVKCRDNTYTQRLYIYFTTQILIS